MNQTPQMGSPSDRLPLFGIQVKTIPAHLALSKRLFVENRDWLEWYGNWKNRLKEQKYDTEKVMEKLVPMDNVDRPIKRKAMPIKPTKKHTLV